MEAERIDTASFATRSEILDRRMLTAAGAWVIGLDYGYSAVKGICMNKAFTFPNCALRLGRGQQILEASDDDLILREKDESGNIQYWVIGKKAQEIITNESAVNNESEFYGRNRYFSPAFKAIVKAGLGIALTNNSSGQYNNTPIYLQTGLPPEYIREDTAVLREALSGNYNFSLKIGKKGYQNFSFSIENENIFIMDQPMGSLFSAITGNDGKRTEQDAAILKSRSIVFDPGFNTLDTFVIASSIIQDTKTFDNLGMHEVFRRTIDALNEQYHCSLNIPGFQKALRDGNVKAFDRKKRQSVKTDFSHILTKNLKDVCEEAVARLDTLYDYLREYDYLIVTGGTGNAWYDLICDAYKGMEGLNVIAANRKDPELSNTYANARGYYLFRSSWLNSKVGRKGKS